MDGEKSKQPRQNSHHDTEMVLTSRDSQRPNGTIRVWMKRWRFKDLEGETGQLNWKWEPVVPVNALVVRAWLHVDPPCAGRDGEATWRFPFTLLHRTVTWGTALGNGKILNQFFNFAKNVLFQLEAIFRFKEKSYCAKVEMETHYQDKFWCCKRFQPPVDLFLTRSPDGSSLDGGVLVNLCSMLVCCISSWWKTRWKQLIYILFF